MQPVAFEAREISRRIGSFTLEASLSLARSDRAVIQAGSGTGKTSLLRMIAGLDRPDRGQLILGGRDISNLAPPEREIGVVFQDAALFPALSVAENVAFGLRMRGVGAQDRKARALHWLEKVGLASRAEDPVTQLSGGEKQRVAFARALIWRPQLLLLDEPFSALDSALRRQLRAELLGLLAEAPVPMILVTHDREDADALATQRWTIIEVGEGIRRLARADRS